MHLHMPKRGSISSLHPRPLKGGVQSVALQPWQAELSVLAVGLNFRDVLNVLGEYPGVPGMPGLDCCGSIIEVKDAIHLSRFDPAFGFAFGSFASYVRTDARLPCENRRQSPQTNPHHCPLRGALFTWRWYTAASRRGQAATAAGGAGLIALEYAWFCRSHRNGRRRLEASGCKRAGLSRMPPPRLALVPFWWCVHYWCISTHSRPSSTRCAQQPFG